MATDKKAIAIGGLLIAAGKFDSGSKSDKNKLQAILGKTIYYQNGKKWFYNTPALANMTLSKLNALTKKIKSA